MSEQREKAGGGLAVALAVIVVLGLPVLYALSVGPFVWLVDHQLMPESCEAIYVPLEWLVESSDTLEDAADWYIDLWR